MAANEPWRMTVDGEEFEVSQPDGKPGTYHFTWLTGPDPSTGSGSPPTLRCNPARSISRRPSGSSSRRWTPTPGTSNDHRTGPLLKVILPKAPRMAA